MDIATGVQILDESLAFHLAQIPLQKIFIQQFFEVFFLLIWVNSRAGCKCKCTEICPTKTTRQLWIARKFELINVGFNPQRKCHKGSMGFLLWESMHKSRLIRGYTKKKCLISSSFPFWGAEHQTQPYKPGLPWWRENLLRLDDHLLITDLARMPDSPCDRPKMNG